MNIRDTLRDAIAQLQHHSIPSAALSAELLLMHVVDKDRAWLYAHTDQSVDDIMRERYFALVALRVGGVPTQHLTGHQEFWGLDFKVAPDVLIPRPETEHVIEVALERLKTGGDSSEERSTSLHIADVGTGSGCIAVALAHELPSAQIVATDISAPALEIARQNAERNGVASRIRFEEGNLLDSFVNSSSASSASSSQPFDLIVSNPPYVGRDEAATLAREVRDHEPHVALFGGETGAEMYEPLIVQAAMLLKLGGILVLELGHNSAEHVAKLLNTPAWSDVAITNDLSGIARVVSAKRK